MGTVATATDKERLVIFINGVMRWRLCSVVNKDSEVAVEVPRVLQR